MKLLLACLLLGLALPTIAQSKKKPEPAAQDSVRDRAIKRCKESRGTDCESREGLREWMREETSLTKSRSKLPPERGVIATSAERSKARLDVDGGSRVFLSYADSAHSGKN